MHINIKDLFIIHKHAAGISKLQKSDDVCRTCRLGKAHKLPFLGHFERSAAVGEILYADIVKPLELSFPDKYKCVSTFLDDLSGHQGTWTYTDTPL